ncbi:MAG: DUF6431 domain-containing protein [Halanaerobium sp.]
MIIINKFLKNIPEYVKLGKTNLYRPYQCKDCGYKGTLHYHGSYSRNVITLLGCHIIYVPRYICPNDRCRKTYSFLPSFVIPYYQYSFSFIFFCLYSIYIFNFSYDKFVRVIRTFNPDSYFSKSNIYFYVRRFTTISPIVNSFFVNYNDLYFDMDKTDPLSTLIKIDLFLKTRGHFNHSYFDYMKFHFMKKTNNS